MRKGYVCNLKCKPESSPRISVSIEKSGREEEVEVGREGANLWLHLSCIPNSWTLLVIFMPRIQNLVGILSDKGIRLH